MNQDIVNLIFGAIVHDIGKVVQRSSKERRKHSAIGGDFIKEQFSNRSIEEIVRYHHYKELAQKNLNEENMAYIVYIADNIASAIDRRLQDADMDKSSYYNWDTYTNQHDIFNVLCERKFGRGERFYQPQMLDDTQEINFPSEEHTQFNFSKYGEIVEKLKQTLSAINPEEKYINSLLNIFESTLSYVPSSTNLDELIDVSLYDHSKITAAFATSIYHYLKDKKITNYKKMLFDKSREFYQEEAFRLLSFDISGIQNFIYTITNQKAAKMLRSRSFYLEILAENLIDEILDRLELSRANLLYSGGGHSYLIIPNTPKTLEIVDLIEKEVNDFLRETYGHNLFIAFGSSPFSGSQLMSINKESLSDYGHIYRAVGQQISLQKLNRYSAEEIQQLNDRGKKLGRECKVCFRVFNDKENSPELGDICPICNGLVAFSRPLQKNDFISVSNEMSQLPIGFGQYLHSRTKKDVQELNTDIRIYAKNKFYTGLNQSIHLWIGDYSEGHEFSEYAEGTDGINRMGIMRCDVDNLGQAFISGFCKQRNSFSRSATFSRNMSLFFKHHINQILESLNTNAQIIYAGGDDVFVVGEWYGLLEFAIALREKFIQYTQGRLTLSTGFGMYHSKTPIASLAQETGRLEEAAKDNGKDSITLFDSSNTFKWDTFIKNIWESKFLLIKENMKSFHEDSYNRTFTYKLMDLINQSISEAESLNIKRGDYKTISWSRWAYFLAKNEPKNPDEKAQYKEFTNQLHKYFSDEAEVKQLKVALELYIYTVRGEK